MSILKKLHSSVFLFVVFLLTGSRPAVGNALPSAQEGQKSDANVSASVADSLELRATDQGGDTKGGDDKGSKSGDDKGSKDGDSGSKGGDDSSKGGGGGGQGGGDGDYGGGGG